MMRTMVKKAISIFLACEFLIIATLIISFGFFINLQVAFLSSFFVIVGASYGYKRMVGSQVSSGEFEDKRDLLDEIEDPHGLYDEDDINDAPYEELNLKEIVKEEKAKIKTFSVKSAKQGVRGSVSAFRLVPYVFLILGFIALKNNNLLDIAIYLPSILVGIVVGSVVAKKIF